MLAWRKRFGERLAHIAERYPPRREVDFEALADMLATLVEGSLILDRALEDGTILPRQILLFRDYVRSVFLADRTGRENEPAEPLRESKHRQQREVAGGE